MAEIAIGYLQHRRNYSRLFTLLIDKIKPENKKLCKIYFYTTGKINLDIQTNIDYEICQFGSHGAMPGQPEEHGNNFGEKINRLADIDCKYVVRTGEDVFVNPHCLDFIIENRHLLDNPKYLSIIPCENLGVPACDLFLDGFCTPEEKREIHKYFLNTDMYKTAGKRWGENELKKLNPYTIGASTWNFNAFMDTIDKFKTDKKGIHPVRFNDKLQEHLAELIINNTERFLRKREYKIIKASLPHTCDNFCLCLQETFNNVRKEFPFVPYEEIPMSLYMRKHKQLCLWVKNGFAYTDIYAFVSRCNPKLFDKYNKDDQNRYQRLLQNCEQYYRNQ